MRCLCRIGEGKFDFQGGSLPWGDIEGALALHIQPAGLPGPFDGGASGVDEDIFGGEVRFCVEGRFALPKHAESGDGCA